MHEFGHDSIVTHRPNRRVTVVVYTITILLHAVLLIGLIRVRSQPVRMSSGNSTQVGIAAYIPGPIGTAGASAPTETPVQPKKTLTTRVAKNAPKEEEGSNAAASGGGQAGSGPVRLGTGGNLTLLNKVTPIYPAIMQSARMPGQVVLDAIIHRDGTIGDVTILSSTNAAFAQAAVAAVKQWKYTPIPYEGIVTVTVNFQLQG